MTQHEDPMQLDSSHSSFYLGSFKKPPIIHISTLDSCRSKELSTTDLNKTWKVQKECLSNLFSLKDINYITVTKLADGLCRFGKSKELYTIVLKEIENQVLSLKHDLRKQNDILRFLKNSWETFITQLETVQSIFIQLDRSFVSSQTKFSSITRLGKHVFSEHILDTTEFRKTVIEAVLNLILLDRDGKKVDLDLIQSILSMLNELNYYTTEFEPSLLNHCHLYDIKQSNLSLSTLSISDYLQSVNDRRYRETTRFYLLDFSRLALERLVLEQWIYDKVEILILKGFYDMMDSNQFAALKLFHDLLSNHSTLDLLRIAFCKYIKNKGQKLIENQKEDQTMIISLLKFKRQMDKIVKDCFYDCPSFLNRLKEGFEYVLNTRGNKPAELLSKYIDIKLKQRFKKINHDIKKEKNMLDKALVLFRFIQTKDAFGSYYKRYLSKRLLLGKNDSDELESYVIEKLKLECGHEFTKDFEHMFSDIQISNDLHHEFKRIFITALPVHIKVVSQTVWPTYPVSTFQLPLSMLTIQHEFESFYATKYNNRKLIWQNTLSSCILTGRFSNGQKEIRASLSQAILLLSFNESDSIGPQHVMELLSISQAEAKGLLQSLSSSNYPILIYQDQVWCLNTHYQPHEFKIKLPPALVDQVQDEERTVERKVLISQQHQLEAAIVRILKSKKTISFQDLLKELFKSFTFSIKLSEVKDRIDSLIEKEYLMKDRLDESIYIYLP